MTNAPSGGSFPRVLMIDPFVDEGEMYGEYLRSSGFVVDIRRDPVDGLRAAVCSQPDIVVTRLRQTSRVLNGIGILRRLKQDVDTSEIPVVIITTSNLPADRAAAAAAACDAYLLLPVTPPELAQELRRLLGRAG